MSHNSFGKIFRVTTWGESHGKAIGCVLDGVPSLIPLTESDIQPFLDKRRPGQSRHTTQRKETDQVEILSGTFEGKTTGSPISLIIYNQDQRSKDYGEIVDKFRPGHADYSYFKKYGIRDYRGGGRSSARETAMRVAAGAVARKIITKFYPNLWIKAALVKIGNKEITRGNWNWDEINHNPFFAPDKTIVPEWEKYLDTIRKKGSSIGAVIEVVAKNVPVGLGEPVYGKMDNEIANAMMSINAVKGVEIGVGFASSEFKGEENADEISIKNGEVQFSNNNAGGTLGGITSGQDLVVRFAVKPTSSILNEVNTIDVNGNNCKIRTKGRHDPCVGIRAVPVGEAMLSCVIADQILRNNSFK